MNPSGTVTKVNVFAHDGLVARGLGSTWTYYLFDPQGSVAQRTGNNGTVTSSSKYEAYGKHVNIPGSITDVYGWNARWGYCFDSETGLYLCQHRYYDSSQGRWLTPDPISYAGGINLYGYCGGGPLLSIDPKGKNMYKWMYTGDWNASDEVYEAALDQAFDTLKNWGRHFAINNGIAAPPAALVIGPVPKAIPRGLGLVRNIPVAGESSCTSGLRVASIMTGNGSIKAAAGFVSKYNGLLWLYYEAGIGWYSTWQTLNDPLLDHEEEAL